jgi:dienelactone hydrolase
MTESPVQNLSRRDALKLSGLGALAVALNELTLTHANAAAPPGSQPALEPLNRFPRMVQEYFVRRVRAIEDAANLRRDAVRSKRDAERYVRDVRGRIQQSFGPWPAKTPLNPRITGTVERDAYRIENVLFDSRPGFPVTANLYLPKGRKLPAPGVVGSCGHSANGKAAEAYQAFAQGLARQGYVCLIFDPIGQGERLQSVDDQLKPLVGVGTREHIHFGNQQFLVGEFFGSWRAWDGIRALDYLLTRPEVDPRHVGVTGNSGGGTMTTWLCGVEQRWTMAAPACFVTTFRRNLENELPADTEQCPPRALALGLDHSDFLAALAPRPVVILAKERDYFDARGAEEAFARLQRLYQLLGAEDNISLHIGPTYHGYTQENREAMYRWFNHVTKVSDAQAEPPLTIEKDETLYCTPRGQVADLKPRTVFSFTSEQSRQLAKARKKLSNDALKTAVLETLRLIGIPGEPTPPAWAARRPAGQPSRRIRGRTGDSGVTPESARGTPALPPDYRILREVRGRNYPAKYATTYAVETEPGIQSVVIRLSNEQHISRPLRSDSRAVLYVSHHSADAELREEPLLAELAKAESAATFYACDVRGIGESKPNTCGVNSFLNPYGCDYFYAIHSLMLDEPYVGRKTLDVLRVLDWLGSIGHREVHLVAKGWGASPATFAALLHDSVNQVTLKNALTSYAAIAEAEHYKWPLSALLPDILKHFDLPDCYHALAAKKLRQIDPWGAEGKG